MYSVLLVDDEPWAIEGLQLFVDWEAHGFRICGVCGNGAEALSAAQELMPDVIVTDIRMPEMDGLELIGQLQEDKGSATQFVVMSAYSEFAFAKRAMQLGVNYYLLKPIIEEEADEVLSQVRMRLDQNRTLRTKQNHSTELSLPAIAVQQMKQVLQAIEDADTKQAVMEIDSLFEKMNSDSLQWCELFVSSLAVQCSKLIHDSGGDSASALPFLSSSSMQAAASELDIMRQRIVCFVEQAICTIKTLRIQKAGNVLTEIDQYVSLHYRNTLRIKEIAAKFYLNPVYLGKAYQDKFGCSLIDRMHDLRIHEACEKLRSSEDPIHAIAEQVGYAHYHYFLRHFEQRTGMKPLEYRASSKRE